MANLETRNFFHLVLDIFWFGLALPATSRFITVYALRVDATALQIGLIAAMPGVVLIFSSALSGQFQRIVPNIVTATSVTGFIMRLAFFLPVLTPLFSKTWQPYWLIFSVSVPALAQGIAVVTFIVLMREAVQPTKFIFLTAQRSIAMNISLGASTFLMGYWLTQLPFPSNYQSIFMAAFIATLLSLWHVSRVRLLPAIESEVAPIAASQPSVWRDRRFSNVIFITFIVHIGYFAVFPLISIYLVDALAHDEQFVGLFMVVELAASAGVSIILPRIARHYSNLALIGAGMMMSGVGTVLLISGRLDAIVLSAAAVTGAGWGIANICILAYFSEKAPQRNSTAHTVVFYQVVAAGIFVGPLLGTTLLALNIPIVPVIIAGSGLRMLIGLIAAAYTPTAQVQMQRFALTRRA